MQLEFLDDSKLIQKSLTFRLLKESSNIYKELKILDYGIQRMLILLFMLTLMQIGLEVLMIGKALVVVNFAWGPNYYLGSVRSKVPLPYLQQKQTMWLPHLVALNSFG